MYLVPVLLGGVILGLLYTFLKYKYSYWKRKGIYSPKSNLIFGHIRNVLFLRETLGDFVTNYYKKLKHLPYFGVYSVQGATIVINDLDIIRNMMTKDFLSFSDHGLQVNEKNDPLAMHLFNLTGEKWKNLRNKLTPTFTTSKIKFMFDTVAKCNVEMIDYVGGKLSAKEDDFDLKDLFATLNTDVIGSCAFGIECNSFKHPDAEFRTMGRRIFDRSPKRIILRFLTMLMPKFVDKLKIGFTEKEIQDFFYNTVRDTIKYREDNKITRNDFLQLLIQLQRDGRVEDDSGKADEDIHDDGTRLTTMQIAAQVFVFFIAGFETSSTTASFALYELALNPDIQNTLRKEIDQVLEKHNGKVTYEALAEMTYLTKVIEETLRKYPPLPVLFRICTKEYTLPGTTIKIEKDTPVFLPVLGIQRDPEFYPDPLKFDPERFSPENKATRHHFSYLPFGEGPRICIGNRFGLMQTRLGLVSLLSKYEVSPCEKTHIPMKYDKKSFILSAEGGVWLKLTNRTK